MNNKSLHLCISGSAGQGIATLGHLLGKVITRQGYALHCSQVYESRIRGGNSSFSLRIGTRRNAAPTEEIDLLVALNAQALEFNLRNLSPSTVIISSNSIPSTSDRHIRIPIKEMGEGAALNTVMAGAVSALLDLDMLEVSQYLSQGLSKLSPDIKEANSNVLAAAYKWVKDGIRHVMSLPPPLMAPGSNLMMNGNEAIALGAMVAGLKFCSFYPMSPSTSIVLAIADEAARMGIVVEQAEDEIAAVNMAIGASFAGARSMVATSGGGLSLMSEGISLAGMVEVPLVIAVAMRPGPATGLPTRTEQSDLNLVLHAGHGEFPRIILSPGSLNECFGLAQKAFYMAEQYQVPVFVLTDQYLADSYRDVEPFEFSIESSSYMFDGIQPEKNVYERYAITENGISPRRIPGFGKDLVVSDSDEHTPDGHISEKPSVRLQMQNKRMAKLEGMRQNALEPNWSGDAKPDLMLVCWGSTIGAVEEAASVLRNMDISVAVCHFTQVYPLRPESFLPNFAEAKQVISVESNCSGQFAALLLAETGFSVDGKVLRYDGLAMTSKHIISSIGAAAS